MLSDAACFGRGKLKSFTPKSSDMVGAMAMSGLEQCYKCMKITNLANKKSVTVEIVDVCGSGCRKNKDIDLTTGAFQKLGNLNTGVLSISFTAVTCPTTGSTFTKIKALLKAAGIKK
jgi:expansin (peptidoglycan-binding protein)